MTRKSKFSEEYEDSVVDYRKTHSEADTVEKYGLSPSTVRCWLKKRGIRLQRFKKLAPNEQPGVRVLKHVPADFKVPHRGIGW